MSWVSAIPPIRESAIERPLVINENEVMLSGLPPPGH
jgi:hypothetical protein